MACDTFFPADLLLLASANADGTAYVETVNLDGESNLKIKKALDATRWLSPDAVARLQARLASEISVQHGVSGSRGQGSSAGQGPTRRLHKRGLLASWPASLTL